MNDIIGIGEAVFTLLGGDAALSALVGSGIYPIVADEGVDFPFVIYRRTGQTDIGSKDGVFGSYAEVEIVCFKRPFF